MMWRISALKQLVAMATILPFFLMNTADAAYGCVATNGGATGCTSQDISFLGVAGFEVTDSLADPKCNCNCGGDTGKVCPTTTGEETNWVTANGHASVDCASVTTPISCWAPFDGPLQPTGVVFGACLGSDDNVNVAITVNLDVSNRRYDVAMYINVVGGNALTGTGSDSCEIVTMVDGTYGAVTVATTGDGTDGDGCPDFASGTGTLSGFAFDTITLRCADNFNDASPSSTVGDNLLDFDIAVVWDQSADSTNCDFESDPPKLPIPGSNPKCWKPKDGARITLPIYVPPYLTPTSQPSLSSAPSSQPSDLPSSQPSANPSISAQPSDEPSSSPSISTQPSGEPSSSPSISTQPSDEPSFSPSESTQPSDEPSFSPSVSAAPSGEPSSSPSISAQPSDEPSSSPSISAQPSDEPSFSPSVSAAPSGEPSSTPSSVPSFVPSSNPSSQPSFEPSVSQEPSISLVPSSSTDEPSSEPSTSHQPSQSPSLSPSVSSMPSSEPTGKPTDQPSFPPTGSPYYPDWISTSQVCINDGLTPAYMKELQQANYLYMDKQECCETHFSWRVRQCMGNDEPVYYRDGSSSTCVKGETRDDYDIAFDTLEECCEEQVWWDVYGCMQDSPKYLEFEFSIEFADLSEPTNCQNADAIAKRLQDAMAPAMSSGTEVLVVGIGAVTIDNDVALGTTQCGGSLSGQSYQGDFSLGVDYSDPSGDVTVVTFRVFKDCSSSGCTSDQSIQSLYDETWQSLETYVDSGSMEQDILDSVNTSPAVPQLQHISVDTASMAPVGTYKDPRLAGEGALIEGISLTVEGELSVSGFDTSSFDAAQEAEAMTYFQAALEASLEAEGLSHPVKVTDIVDGKIVYEILITADSSSDATTAASSIETSLAADATRSAIASNAAAEATSASSSIDFSTVVIDGNTETATTEIPVAKITVEGEFATNDVNFGSADEIYLEEAIYEVLLDEGVISEGAKVEVTGYVGGVITYNVISFTDAASDVQAHADSIASQITQTSTYTQIANVAQSLPGSTITSFSISAGVYLSTTGMPHSIGWWPQWNWGESTCENGGDIPSYMTRNQQQYFSSSKRECCQQWFPYALKTCVGPTTGGSTVEYIVPNWIDRYCESKKEGDMEEYELADTFETIEECCKKRFSTSYSECCRGECVISTTKMYYPEYGKCVEGVEGEMLQHQLMFAEDSVQNCCSSNFWWLSQKECCEISGGCYT